MKILKDKQWKYILGQIEVRNDIISELMELVEYYKGESEILIDMVEEAIEDIEELGVGIANKSDHVRIMGENKKLNNLMEERYKAIERIVRRS